MENKPPLDKAKALESHKICTAIQIPDQARRWTPQKIKALWLLGVEVSQEEKDLGKKLEEI